MSGRKNIPPPPLKPASAFFLWRNENYDQLKEELLGTYGQLKGLTLSKRIGNMWKRLEEKKKDKYLKDADKLYEKYSEELKDYVDKYGERVLRKNSRTRVDEKSKRKSKSKSKQSKSKAKSTKACC